MILSDFDIITALDEGRLKIDPRPPLEQFNTSALDLVFDGPVYRYKSDAELSKKEAAHRPVIIDSRNIISHEIVKQYAAEIEPHSDRQGEKYYPIMPGEFRLGNTVESFDFPKNSKLAARIEGRSSLARLGLVIHLTAPTVHCGFRGTLVLEMCNFGEYEIRLYPRQTRVCQLVIEEVLNKPGDTEIGQHQGQTGAG